MPEHFNIPWLDTVERLGAGSATSRGATHSCGSIAGVSCSWQDFPGGTGAMVEALGSGRLDIAVLLTEGAVAGIARGASYEIFSNYVESPLIWGIHVRPAAGIDDVGELASARFAISRYGSGSHLMVLALANERGWIVTDDQFVVVGSLAGAIDAFAGGSADVFLWERFMTQPVVDRGDFQRLGEFIAPWSAFVTCANPDVVDRRAELEALIGAVGAEAQRFAVDPGTPERVASRFGLDQEQVRAWLARTRWANGIVSAQHDVAAATAMLIQAGVINGS